VTSVRMFFSYNNGEKTVEVPVIPNELPSVVQQIFTQEHTTQNATLTLIGNKKPRTFSMELFLPMRYYPFARGTGEDTLNLLGTVHKRKIPMRIVITDGLNEILNIAVVVERFSYYFDRAENIRCEIDFSEYVFLESENGGGDDTDIVTFHSVKVDTENVKASVSGINRDGSNLVRTRDILNLLGIEVGWNAERKRVTADGVLLDIHTEIYNGCAYSFIRDIAEEVGIDVDWDEENKTVKINRGGDEVVL